MIPIRVVLVDDHPILRSGIRTLLEQAGDILVVGEGANASDALDLVNKTHPDVILLDMELPGMPGTEVAQQIQQLHLAVKILVLSAHDDPIYVKSLLETGAAGYLMKEEAPEVILEALRGVAHGEQGWFSRRVAARMADLMTVVKTGAGELTMREHEVLAKVVEGKTNQAIAADLGISEKTVEKYLREIFTKLNVNSRVEAAVFAIREGLV